MMQPGTQEPLGHSLSRICRLTHARMYALTGQIGLHRGQSLVLKVLWGQDGLTHSELSNLLHVAPATMTNMITRMEKSGLVERRSDAHDQRMSHVYLTEAGNAIETQVQHMWTEFEAQVFDGFDADEREMLRQAFERIQVNLLRLDEENVEV